LKTTTLAILLATAAGTLAAQEGTKWVDVQGAFITQDHSGIKDSLGYGLGVGGWFTNRWGLEVSALNTDLKAKDLDISGRETHGFVSGLMNFNPGGEKWWPYLRLGAGATQLASPWSGKSDSTTRLNLHGGVGVQGALAENFLGSLEARAVRVETSLATKTEYLALVGLGYRWGAPKAAPAPVPAPPAPPPPRGG